MATDRQGGTSIVMRQIPLGLRLRESATFDNFVIGGNAELITVLNREDQLHQGMIYIWGGSSTGRSHLLQAVCHRDSGWRSTAFYLPLAQSADLDPAVLNGLASFTEVCIDDVDCVVGQTAWEQALFGLCNEIRECGGRLIVTARLPAPNIPWRLADLSSRLSWGVTYHLQPLNDQGKYEALVRRAAHRGLELPKDVGNFLLTRCDRDLGGLFALLDDLDNSSLVYKRRLTIPFVKECLAQVSDSREPAGAPDQGPQDQD